MMIPFKTTLKALISNGVSHTLSGFRLDSSITNFLVQSIALHPGHDAPGLWVSRNPKLVVETLYLKEADMDYWIGLLVLLHLRRICFWLGMRWWRHLALKGIQPIGWLWERHSTLFWGLFFAEDVKDTFSTKGLRLVLLESVLEILWRRLKNHAIKFEGSEVLWFFHNQPSVQSIPHLTKAWSSFLVKEWNGYLRRLGIHPPGAVAGSCGECNGLIQCPENIERHQSHKLACKGFGQV